jgi:DNA-binding transcriptional ArsR family regulator
MPKVTLDMTAFKALASDTRLDILRALDGKKMSLKEISKVTRLNKATLHEHLQKLNEAGLVKRKEREGHKWVYYKLTWKGEGLLHPENTRIVVMFTATFVALAVGIVQLLQFVKGYIVTKTYSSPGSKLIIDNTIKSKEIIRSDSDLEPIIHIGTWNATDSLTKYFSYDSAGTSPYNPIEPFFDDAISKGSIIMQNIVAEAKNKIPSPGVYIVKKSSFETSKAIEVAHDPTLQIIGIICIAVFFILLTISIWRYKKNRAVKI